MGGMWASGACQLLALVGRYHTVGGAEVLGILRVAMAVLVFATVEFLEAVVDLSGEIGAAWAFVVAFCFFPDFLFFTSAFKMRCFFSRLTSLGLVCFIIFFLLILRI